MLIFHFLLILIIWAASSVFRSQSFLQTILDQIELLYKQKRISTQAGLRFAKFNIQIEFNFLKETSIIIFVSEKIKMIKSKQNTEHYNWGENCDSWVLVNSENLSIKQEIMPPNSKEELHSHKNAQQFFFILKGKATFVVDGEVFKVAENSGFYITPNKNHLIENKSDVNLEFLVISNPSTNNDRFVIKN